MKLLKSFIRFCICMFIFPTLSSAQGVQRLRIPIGEYSSLSEIPVYCIDMALKAPTSSDFYTQASENIIVTRKGPGNTVESLPLNAALQNKWLTIKGLGNDELIRVRFQILQNNYDYKLSVTGESGFIGPKSSYISKNLIKNQKKIEDLEVAFNEILKFTKTNYATIYRKDILLFNKKLQESATKIQEILNRGGLPPAQTQLLKSRYKEILSEINNKEVLKKILFEQSAYDNMEHIKYLIWLSESKIFSEGFVDELFAKYFSLADDARKLNIKTNIAKQEIEDFKNKMDVLKVAEDAYPLNKSKIKELPPPSDESIALVENGVERKITANELREKVEEMECGVDDICYKKTKGSISVSFACEFQGKSISLKIGTDKAFEFEATTKSGVSMKLEKDEDGELKYSNSVKVNNN